MVGQVQLHFPEATVTGYEKLIELMTNHPKDRHVVAAAVRCGAQAIVTFNLKDFPTDSMAEWDLEAQHPDEFLVRLYELNPRVVVSKLYDQADTIGRTLPEVLQTLRNAVPEFVNLVAKLELKLPAIE